MARLNGTVKVVRWVINMTANELAIKIASGKSVEINGVTYSFCDFVHSNEVDSDALLLSLLGNRQPLEDWANKSLVAWVGKLINGVDMSNPSKESIKKKSDKLRIQIMQLSDDELTFADAESFATKFQSLPELIVSMSEKAKKELPF